MPPVDFGSAFTDDDYRRALQAGADKVLDGARRRAPKKSGALAANGRARVLSPKLAVVVFDKVYAGKQERRDESWRKYRYHHTNGQAHYVRDAAAEDGDDAISAFGDALFGGE